MDPAIESNWNIGSQAYQQISDFVLVSVGGNTQALDTRNSSSSAVVVEFSIERYQESDLKVVWSTLRPNRTVLSVLWDSDDIISMFSGKAGPNESLRVK